MMRIIRVEFSEPGSGGGDGGGGGTPGVGNSSGGAGGGSSSQPLIGVRYPAHLLPEVVQVLEEQQVLREQQQAQQVGGAAAAAAAAAGGGAPVGVGRTEAATPVDPKSLKKAFMAPRTLLSFFQPRPASGAPATTGTIAAGNGAAGKGGGALCAQKAKLGSAPQLGPAPPLGSKRARTAGVAPPAKRHVGGGGAGKQAQLFPSATSNPVGQAMVEVCVVDLAGEEEEEEEEEVEQELAKTAAAAGARQVPAAAAAAAVPTGAAAAVPTGAAAGRRGSAGNAPLPPGHARPGNGSSSGCNSGAGAGAAGRPPEQHEPDAAAMEALLGMGFDVRAAERALRVTRGDAERAANWLLANC